MNARTGIVPDQDERIESWKSIAAFFSRDERTVKRWEKERGLPIHRLPGDRGGIFAYAHELNLWRDRAQGSGTATEDPAPPPQNALILPPVAPAENLLEAPPPPPRTQNARHRVIAIGALASMVIVLAISARSLGLLYRNSAKAAAAHPATPNASPNAEAEDLYLQGRYYWNRRTTGDLNRAVDALTQAIDHDPGFAAAYAGLAETYNLMPEYGTMTPAEAYPRAADAAKKALALDDRLPEAHAALAFALFYWDWRVPVALAEYKKAIQLDPMNANAHHWYAASLLPLGRYLEASAEIERARELDPASRSILADQAQIGLSTGSRDQSVAMLEEIERTEPDFLSPPRYLAGFYWDQKNYPGFIAASARAASVSKDPNELAVALAARDGWARGGEQGLLQSVRRAQEAIFRRGESSGYALATTCVRLGANAEAVNALQSAFHAHDVMMLVVFASGVYSGNELNTRLQGDPGFEQLRKQVQARIHETN
ncbi:MAG TPA: hypothetical protein VHX60_14955 [Acidobacteriaceae bacterium]|nr:hypothetical protein [Acidobacteriaceae bacterium]